MPRNLKKLYKQFAVVVTNIYQHKDTPAPVIRAISDFLSDLDSAPCVKKNGGARMPYLKGEIKTKLDNITPG